MLIYYNCAAKGGHFAAWEQPDIFARELRAHSNRCAELEDTDGFSP